MSEALELTQYNPVKAEIAALKAQNAALVFVYDTPEGNKNARSHVHKLRGKKGEVERVRKEAKAEALEFGRRVDAVAKELTDDIDGMIEVHQKPLDEIEAKAAALKAEAERKAADAKAEADRIEREKQEAIIAAERAEAARVKAELDALRKKEHEDRIAREAAQKAREEAEAKAARDKAAAEARERAAVEAAARAEREKAEAVLKAERDKIEAERAALVAEQRAIQAAKEAEQRAAQAAKDAAVKAAREREVAAAQAKERMRDKKVRKAIVDEIAASIAGTCPVSLEAAAQIATAILDGKISRVRADVSAAEPAMA